MREHFWIKLVKEEEEEEEREDCSMKVKQMSSLTLWHFEFLKIKTTSQFFLLLVDKKKLK